MKLMFSPYLFHLLLYSATQTLGVKIDSVPAISGGDIIQTELEKTVSLICLSDSTSDTEAGEELVWLRNDAAVSLMEGNRNGRSSVCVSPIIYDDNGATFTCHLRNNATVRASVTLNVTYPPELSGAEEVFVEIETELVLRCDVRASPPVSSVLWTLNGSSVDLLAGGFRVTNDGFSSHLSTTFVQKDLHEGTYQCTVVSPVYGEYSKRFQVTVTEKTLKFPLMPIIAGVVVVFLTAVLAVVTRWKRIQKCCLSCRK